MFVVNFFLQRRNLHACIITTCLLFLAGCVFRRVAFSNASTLLKMRIDSAFNLTQEQADFVDKKLQTFLTELNKDEIRQLQALVSEAGKQIEKQTTHTEVARFFERWDGIYGSAVRRAAPSVGELLARLKQEQIKNFELFINQRNQKKLDRLSEGEIKFRERRIQTVTKQISEWLGPLSKAQNQAVMDFAIHEFKRSKIEQAASLESKGILFKALSEKKSAEFLGTLFIGQQAFPYETLVPLHTQSKGERRKAWISLITQIVSTVTPNQISKFKKETDSLALDLLLIGEAESAE